MNIKTLLTTLLIAVPLGGAVGCIATSGDLAKMGHNLAAAQEANQERLQQSQADHQARQEALLTERLEGSITQDEYAESLSASFAVMMKETQDSWAQSATETGQSIAQLVDQLKTRGQGLSTEVGLALGGGGAGVLALLGRWGMRAMQTATATQVHRERDRKYIARGDMSSAYTMPGVPELNADNAKFPLPTASFNPAS